MFSSLEFLNATIAWSNSFYGFPPTSGPNSCILEFFGGVNNGEYKSTFVCPSPISVGFCWNHLFIIAYLQI
jgi:hypothetical protein